MLQVIKVGGAALNDATWLQRFADAATHGDHARLVVHGGGPDITRLSFQLGLPAEFCDGRRVTSDAALDAASMVLNGRINKRIVRALRARGIDAFGLSGEDGGVMVGRLVDGGALGRVGEVVSIRTSLLKALIAADMLPVVSPISIGIDFGALNINADEAATAMAQKMEANELLFLTDVEGVREHNVSLRSLNVGDAQQLIDGGVATGGMALKLRAAIAALRAGVPKVRIGALEMLWDEEAGTAINAEAVACR